MSETACSRTIDIPELLDFISTHLSLTDLLVCVQVNRQWHEAFIPKLWHTIDDTQVSWKRVLLECQNNGPTPSIMAIKKDVCLREAFYKYGHFIRRLRVHSSLLVDIASTSTKCTQLAALEINLDDSGVGEEAFWNRNIQADGSGPRSPVFSHVGLPIFHDEGILGGYNHVGHIGDGLNDYSWISPLDAPPAILLPDEFRDWESSFRMNGLDMRQRDYIQLEFKDAFEPPIKSKPPFSLSTTTRELRKGLLFTQYYWNWILANPGLRRLHLTGHGALQWRVRSTDFFFRVLSTLKELRDLCALEHLQLDHLCKLHEVAPSVNMVTVQKTWKMSGEQGLAPVNGNNSGQVLKNPAIKTLRFNKTLHSADNFPAVSSATTPWDVLTALSWLPNLENLTVMDYVHDNRNYQVANSLTDIYAAFLGLIAPSSHELLPTPVALPPNEQGFMLKRLYVSERRHVLAHSFVLPSVMNLTPLIRHLPNLQELRTSSLSNESIGALATHCKNLEVLEYVHDNASAYITFDSPPNGENVYPLFASCPKLRVFKGIDQCVRADDMIREPWVCRGIEMLHCRIVGVVRLTEVERAILDNVLVSHPTLQHDCGVSGILPALLDEERTVVQKHLRSQEQQRQIYERLAMLQNLKHLELGNYSIQGRIGLRSSLTLDTLELSLESGLGQLGSLKNLEMFGFEGLNYRIERKELEWMAKSWCKLKRMHGLGDNPFKVGPGMERSLLREYMQTLRPDIVHISFFGTLSRARPSMPLPPSLLHPLSSLPPSLSSLPSSLLDF